MSSNPYSDNNNKSPYTFETQLSSGGNDAYVKQIPVIGILNIVHASLELLMSLMLFGFSIFMIVMQNDPKFAKMPNAVQMQYIVIGYVTAGALLCIFATLRLVAGIMVLRRRGRIFSIVASVLGLASVFTCYCSLTSLGLCVYTLVVLVQPSVMAEFDRART